jgi:hypothetical protein
MIVQVVVNPTTMRSRPRRPLTVFQENCTYTIVHGGSYTGCRMDSVLENNILRLNVEGVKKLNTLSRTIRPQLYK